MQSPSPEVDINFDESDQLPPILNRPKRTIFVDGFVDNRLHNQSLLAIIHDLLSTYYLTSNPTMTDSGSRSHVHEMVSAAEAILFLMNEFTLNDKRCLMALQYGWELMIPIVMLRHPRMKLVINQTARTHNPNTNNQQDELDMALLQDILYDGYKQSVTYDRFQHTSGIKQIRARLRQVLNLDLNSLSPYSPLHSGNGASKLKLPPIRSAMNGGWRSPVSPLPTLPQRSRSMINEARIKKTKVKTTKDNLSKQNSSPINVKEKAKNEQNGSMSDIQPLGKSVNNLFRSMSKETIDTEDTLLYQNTQYLIFPIKDKNQKPKLINFPGDVVVDEPESRNRQNSYDFLEVKSVWGSDSSLDEEVKYAQDLQGNLDINSPPASPAPYLGALE